MQVHTVARRTVKSAAIQIDRKTNQQVKKQTNVLDANTGDILMPSDIKQLQVYKISNLHRFHCKSITKMLVFWWSFLGRSGSWNIFIN